jgi:subfamily B ATP-binding cassette protein MsbA
MERTTTHGASPSSLPLIRRLVSTYLWPYRAALALAVLFMVVGAAMTALFARLIQPVMDDVLAHAGTNADARAMIIPIGVAIFTCFLVRGLASYGQAVQMARIGGWVIRDIQTDLFRRLVSQDLAFFNKNPSGQLTSRMIADVNVMRGAAIDCLAGIGSSGLTLLLLCGVMIYQDFELSLIALGVLPLASGMVAYLGRRLRGLSKRMQDHTALLVDRLSEIFSSIRHVKAYGMEGAETERAASAIDDVRKLNVKAVRVGELLTPVNEILVGLAVFAIIVYGGYKIADGQTTAGALMSFIAAFALAYEPMKKLGKLNNILQIGLGGAERVFALMDTPPEIVNKPDAKPLIVPAPPTISFHHVGFTYTAGETAILNDINILCPAGKVTALVGPSGGGKTTLLNMVMRFYDVNTGSVLINGTDIRDVTIESLRSHMALVSQDISIFNAPIRDNIAYGSMGVDDATVVAAARAAAAHDFISALPHGYDTVVGENGVLLSGGQRQRLAIARAMIRNAPILLLDEATSALDQESEQVVQSSLKQLESGRTTLVIAHRLSTVRHADQIVVIDGGRVVETGRHTDLIAAGGAYARLHGELVNDISEKVA